MEYHHESSWSTLSTIEWSSQKWWTSRRTHQVPPLQLKARQINWQKRQFLNWNTFGSSMIILRHLIDHDHIVTWISNDWINRCLWSIDLFLFIKFTKLSLSISESLPFSLYDIVDQLLSEYTIYIYINILYIYKIVHSYHISSWFDLHRALHQ